MLKIATHDSATGEKGNSLFSWFAIPFSRTQNKTISEQYNAGCRMFDIRVKFVGGVWKCAHGLWTTKREAEDIISEINGMKDSCYVSLTYEGGKKYKKEFIDFANHITETYTNIKWGGIAIKYGEGSHLFKVKYEYLKPQKGWPKNIQGFLPLDGRSLHILLPIPWLWKKIYFDKPEFSEDYYTYVDFL